MLRICLKPLLETDLEVLTLSEPRVENKMGTMPVGKLLISMAVPMMISMLVQALYNIVDSMFVAKLSQDALTAVSLAFSMQNLMFAIAIGTGVGVNALLSKSLGEKNFELANKAAGNSIFLSLCMYAIYVIIGIFFVDVYFDMQTNDVVIAQLGKDYMHTILIVSLGMLGQICMERLLTSTGKTFYSMITQITGAVINMIMDPIMIFGYFGFPALGVKGAAIATVFGQFVACLLGLYFNLKKNTELTFSFKYIKPDLDVIKRIYAVGIPSIIMQSIGSIMVFGLNKILIAFSTTAVAVFGVYFKLQSFIFMPVFGINNGMVPIIAYNYGARNRRRIVDTTRFAVVTAVGIMTIGLIIFQVAPELLLSIFASGNPEEDAALIKIGVPALRTIAFHFPIAGICIMLGSVFQALGKPMYSLINSIARQLIVLLPAAYFLSLTGNLNMVWFAFIVAEGASLLFSLIFFKRVLKLIDFKDVEIPGSIEISEKSEDSETVTE